MTAKPEMGKKPKATFPPQQLRRLVHATAATFAVFGLVMLYSACDNILPLSQPDGLFDVSNRTLLVVAGALHLVVGGLLFFARDLMSQGLIALWAGLNHVVYLAGLAWLKAAVPLPAVVVVAWELRVSTGFVYIVWKSFIALLIIGGTLLVLLERRRLKQTHAEVFLERWGEMRENKVTSPTQGTRGPVSVGHGAVTRDSPRQHTSQGEAPKGPLSEFKFSCPNCGQHIRCDQGYRGRKIACPACQEQIQVPRAKDS
jgi:hypothetical protein